VPVTTVPKPVTVKTRSTGSRKGPSWRFSSTSRPMATRVFFSSSIPSPLREETGIMGASSRKEPAR
jgi:hypothetical protein